MKLSSSASNGFILMSNLNSFHMLWEDSEELMSLATSPELASGNKRTRLSRTAALIYVISFEALVNRAIGDFLVGQDREDGLAREKIEVKEKVKFLVSRFPVPTEPVNFGALPWSHLLEVIEMRNDYVHPKHGRRSIVEAFAGTKGPIILNLEPNRIPNGLRRVTNEKGKNEEEDALVGRDDVVYNQTGLPRDPSAFTFEEAQKVRAIIRGCIMELDRLLSGALIKDNWIQSDQFHLIHPTGKSLIDDALPPFPAELRSKYVDQESR